MHSAMEELGAPAGDIRAALQRLRRAASAGDGDRLHISARLFFHTFITVGDGARACEIRLQRKKGTRNVSSELVIKALASTGDTPEFVVRHLLSLHTGEQNVDGSQPFSLDHANHCVIR